MTVRSAIRVSRRIFFEAILRQLQGDMEGAHQTTREWITMNHTFAAAEVDLAELSAAFERLFPSSNWPTKRSRHERGPSYVLSAVKFIAHMVATTAIYAALITLAWSLGVLCTLLNGIQLFSDEMIELVSRVELALAYFDTALCGYFSIHGAWRFFKETTR
jgi:hypothetical protein